MDKLMNVDPGLMIWTLITFLSFLALLIKFGTKPIMNGLKAREERIRLEIENAEKNNAQAQKLMKETEDKLYNAQKEMAEIVNKGKLQSEEIIRKATEEADRIKKQKTDDAVREIERSKETAIKELRTEVAGLVIQATEKLLDETLDREKHLKLIETYIQKLPNN